MTAGGKNRRCGLTVGTPHYRSVRHLFQSVTLALCVCPFPAPKSEVRGESLPDAKAAPRGPVFRNAAKFLLRPPRNSPDFTPVTSGDTGPGQSLRPTCAADLGSFPITKILFQPDQAFAGFVYEIWCPECAISARQARVLRLGGQKKRTRTPGRDKNEGWEDRGRRRPIRHRGGQGQRATRHRPEPLP